MNTTTQLGFISSKIGELETAVFHSHSNSVLNLNATVINTLKIDDNGYIWFFVNKPVQTINEFEKQFPVALNYYKKGATFFLNVFGVARIVNDPEELAISDFDDEIKQKASSDKLLLCVKIAHVNYYEKENSVQLGWFGKIKKSLSELFVPADDYYYHPEFDTEKHFA
jgi:general stress protein 26